MAIRIVGVDLCLAAERDHDPLGPLEVDDVHHVLDGQGLEVELVGCLLYTSCR